MFSTIQRPSATSTWITFSLLPPPISTKGSSPAPRCLASVLVSMVMWTPGASVGIMWCRVFAGTRFGFRTSTVAYPGPPHHGTGPGSVAVPGYRCPPGSGDRARGGLQLGRDTAHNDLRRILRRSTPPVAGPQVRGAGVTGPGRGGAQRAGEVVDLGVGLGSLTGIAHGELVGQAAGPAPAEGAGQHRVPVRPLQDGPPVGRTRARLRTTQEDRAQLSGDGARRQHLRQPD